jgi:hypothetical protein
MSRVHPALSSEAQLLLLSAALVPEAQWIRALVASPLDWGLLVQLAIHQKALPVLWRSLEAVAPEHVPAEARSAMQPLAMVADFRMAMFRQRLGEIVEAFADEGIRTMVLKGAGLGLTVYPRFDDRPMGDIDLLVEEARARDAQAVLVSAGWDDPTDGGKALFYEQHHHLAPLRDPTGTGVWVELHSDIFAAGHPFRSEMGELWARSQRVPLGRATTQVPDPHDALIHLCIHFLWSHGARIGSWRTFRDVDALLRSGRIEWRTLQKRAVSARALTCVYWTLRLAKEVAKIDLDADALDRFRPRGSARLLVGLEHHLATGLLPSRCACPSMKVTRWMWEAAVQPRFSGHGSSRPWAHHRLVTTTFFRGRPPSLWTRILTQMKALRGWTRYLGAVLLPPRTKGA